jgi:hypothetical protein
VRGAYDGTRYREVRVDQSLADPWARWTAVADEPLVLATIERSPETWLSAETIANETGLPPGRVRTVLDTTAAEILVLPADASGRPACFSTRSHYRATTSLLRRYVDAVLTS